MTERVCLVHGLMCHHIRFMDVSSLVSVLKQCKLLCRRCTQISGCLDCSLFSHPGVCFAVIMKAIIANLILTVATSRLISGTLTRRCNPHSPEVCLIYNCKQHWGFFFIKKLTSSHHASPQLWVHTIQPGCHVCVSWVRVACE